DWHKPPTPVHCAHLPAAAPPCHGSRHPSARLPRAPCTHPPSPTRPCFQSSAPSDCSLASFTVLIFLLDKIEQLFYYMLVLFHPISNPNQLYTPQMYIRAIRFFSKPICSLLGFKQ